MGIAVIDVETTGVYAGGNDRVIEVGIVLLDQLGNIEKEYETLVNPERDLGPTHIHGIKAAEAKAAPIFGDVAGDILEVLDGATCVAGHNVRFDIQFLRSELARLGAELGEVEYLCTYRAFGQSLEGCCRDLQIELGDAHRALVDARATAQLVNILIEDGYCSVDSYKSPVRWPEIAPRGTHFVTREKAREVTDVQSGFLSSLQNRLSFELDDMPEKKSEYLASLSKILEDRVLDESERQFLASQVEELGLAQEQARELHVEFLDSVIASALADRVITDHEMSDLQSVARLLDLDTATLAKRIESLSEKIDESQSTTVDDELVGKKVCFSGKIISTLQGEVITKAIAYTLSEKAGLQPAKTFTKQVDILVAADGDTQSGKAKKAAAYGKRIITERAFWPMIGVQVN
jgi:DNA polymerase III epsilon subunit-like protein